MKPIERIEFLIISGGNSKNPEEDNGLNDYTLTYFQLVCGIIAIDVSKKCVLDPIYKILLEPTERRVNKWATQRIETLLNNAEIYGQNDRDFAKYMLGLGLLCFTVPILVKTTVRI